MRLKKYFMLSYVSILLSISVGCSRSNLTGPSGYDKDTYTHTVKYHGENLSIIALWYSGSAKAADELARYNPNLKGKSTIKTGTRIQIPAALIKRTTSMPRDFVRETLRSHPKKPQQKNPKVAQPAPTSTPESTEQSNSSTVITDTPESAARRRQVLQELLEE